ERFLDPTRIIETPFFSRFSHALLPARFNTEEFQPWGSQRDPQARHAGTGGFEGIAFPVHAGTGVVNIVGFLGTKVNLDSAERDRLHLLAIRVIDRLRDIAGPAPTVSRRQLDCMRWIAAGKTSQEIADLLEISEHTVNHH